MCDHLAIKYCRICDVVFCQVCGKEWGEGFEVEWFNDAGDIIAINYTCRCGGVGKNTGCGCYDGE